MIKKKMFVVFALIFIIALSVLLFNLFKAKLGEQGYKEVAEHYAAQPPPSEQQLSGAAGNLNETAQDGSVAQPEILENPVDFEALGKRNPDIYAWISIPGTAVNYPLVQSADDDSYYLNHTVEGVKGYPGSIYTERLNMKDFNDPNTVIYGHNMKDGTMFGGLHQYKDRDYMRDNAFIYIYTPQQVFQYRIFGGITYDDRHILKFFDFETETQYQQYLDSLFQVRNLSSYIDEEIAVDTDDRIITLSTCTKSDDQRFLLLAVLIQEQPDE